MQQRRHGLDPSSALLACPDPRPLPGAICMARRAVVSVELQAVLLLLLQAQERRYPSARELLTARLSPSVWWRASLRRVMQGALFHHSPARRRAVVQMADMQTTPAQVHTTPNRNARRVGVLAATRLGHGALGRRGSALAFSVRGTEAYSMQVLGFS